jgi:tryptophan-rich sensory protein
MIVMMAIIIIIIIIIAVVMMIMIMMWKVDRKAGVIMMYAVWIMTLS